MAHPRITLVAAVAAAGCAAAPAAADLVEVQVQELHASELPTTAAPPDVDVTIFRYWVVFDDPDNRLLNVGDVNIETTAPGGWYQHPQGGDFSPNSALFGAFPNLAADTFVTLGNNGPDGDPGGPDGDIWSDTITDPTPDFNMFGSRIVGGWFNVPPTNGLGDAGNYTGLRVPLLQLGIEGHGVITGDFIVFWQGAPGDEPQSEPAQMPEVPAPPTVTALAFAALIRRRPRRRE